MPDKMKGFPGVQDKLPGEIGFLKEGNDTGKVTDVLSSVAVAG